MLTWFPATQDVFDRFGFGLLRRSFLRQTVARTTTLTQAAALKNVDIERFLTALNEVAERNGD